MKRLLKTLGSFGLARAIALLVAVLLVVGALVAALIGGRAFRGPESAPSDEPPLETPALDDVPDPTMPPGEIRPGTVGGSTGEAPTLVVVANRLLVKFEEGTPPRVVNSALARAGVAPRAEIDETGTTVVAVPPAQRAAALDLLAASSAVDYAEADVVLQALDTDPNDPHWGAQWGPKRVAAPTAWDGSRGSGSAVIAVLDTGVDFGHEDLRGATLPGFDFVNNDTDPADDQGHGTAAAGVAAARTNNTLGVAGMCWSCPIMPVKVLDANGSGSTSTVAQGIVWATDNGARVISMSLGGPGATQTLADAVAYAASKGVVLVAAAGNSSSSTPFYPAAYPSVIAVGGTDSADRLYGWSNYGSWVHVAAPGCNVAPLRSGGYGTFCGTSSATPIVAGLAGLVLAARPDVSNLTVSQTIMGTATPIGGAVQHGIVNAARSLGALNALPPAPPPPPPPPPTSRAATKGTISAASPRKVFRLAVGRGNVVARLSFGGNGRLTLAIIDSHGKMVRRLSRGSPLLTAVTAGGGTFRFVVEGHRARRVRFTLEISYPAP
jgi:subtilisin family serine protease